MVLKRIDEEHQLGGKAPKAIEISRYLSVPPPILSRTFNSLQAQGLIERNLNVDNRRSVITTLTKKGKEALKRAILTGLIATLSMRILATVQAKNASFERLLEKTDITKERLELLKQLSFGMSIFITAIFALIITYLLCRIFFNKNAPKPQGYITFLLVISIIFSVFSLLSLLALNLLSLISLATNILLIVAAIVQKNYKSVPPPAD